MPSFQPTDQQEELVDQICKWFHDYESGHRIRSHPQWFSYSGGAGTGKAVPDDELIPTPNGFIRADKLNVGDYLFDVNGQPTKILGVYPQPSDVSYKLTFTDGRTARCSIDHLWPIYNRKTNRIEVKPLKEFINKYSIGVNSVVGKHSKRVSIPSPGPVEFNHQDIIIDGWTLGVFIGNGCLRESYLTISCGDDEIPNMIADKYGFTVHRNSIYNYSYIFKYPDGHLVKTAEFFKDVPELINKHSYEKDIPLKYMINDLDTRFDVLSGLLDTDGHIDPIKYRVNYSTVSLNLANSIISLARSLGLRASITEDRRDKYTCGICYCISISCHPEIKTHLFRYSRKRNIALNATKLLDTTYILRYDLLTLVSIEQEHITKLRCFYVDNPNHIFITGDYVPTHNTTVLNLVIEKLGLDESEYITAAYCGKAALNLQQHNLPSCTVHSLIYHTILEKVKSTDEEIENGEPPVKMKFHFVLKDVLPANLRLIAIDEATMINNDMRDKILSFGLPVIFIGDMNQLPPIFGVSDVMLNPDFTLTKIMRQAEGNPIIQLSQMILNDDYYDLGDYGNSKVVDYVDFDKHLLTDYDMILCGKNKTRDKMNSRIINDILLKDSLVPFIGAKVVNRQNNWDVAVNGISLTNGLVGYITNLSKKTAYKGYYTIDFRPDFMDAEFEGLHIDPRYIQSDYEVRKSYGLTKFEKFEYAYCITTHISQGSQYNRVLFFDEPFHDAEVTKKLRYTAITRAIDNITIVRPKKSFTSRTLWNSDSYNDYRRKYE